MLPNGVNTYLASKIVLRDPLCKTLLTVSLFRHLPSPEFSVSGFSLKLAPNTIKAGFESFFLFLLKFIYKQLDELVFLFVKNV